MIGPLKDYSSCTLQELLDDDQFIQLAKNRGISGNYSKTWIQLNDHYPSSQAIFMEAALLIELLADNGGNTEHDSTAGWNQIAKKIQGKHTILYNWQRIAAILIIAASIAGVVIFKTRAVSQVIKWEAGITQARTLDLPDESVVVLSPGSQLSYKGNWEKRNIREVWLSGDAHFEVNHINKDRAHIEKGERFIVHVDNVMDVEVLGTVFNIKHHAGKTFVELETGSVKIAVKKRKDYVWLKPGEQMGLDTVTHILTRTVLAENNTSSLTEEKIVELNNTNVVDIIQLIEGNFHKKVKVEDTSILTRKIDGTLPMNKESEVLLIISGILNVDIDNTDPGVITIRPK